MNKPLPSEMNSAERISFCKDGLIDCKKNQRRILWIGLASIIVSYCLFFGVGTPILWIYINLRRVYSSLSEVYEAELDAVKDNE
jgi:hypothetical protein